MLRYSIRATVYAIVVSMLLLSIGIAGEPDKGSTLDEPPLLQPAEKEGEAKSRIMASSFAGECGGNCVGKCAGISYFDLQHIGSMGRQIVYDPRFRYVHFMWTGKDEYPSSQDWPDYDMGVTYNSYSLQMQGFVYDGGRSLFTPNNGFVTVDVSSEGGIVFAWQQWYWSDDYGKVYEVHIGWDKNPPMMARQSRSPGAVRSNRQGIVTGDSEEWYAWPVVEQHRVGGSQSTHLVCTEYQPSVQEPKSIVYYRLDWDDRLYWSDAKPDFIDESYVLSATVRSSLTSGKVAIVYLKPIYGADDPNNDCDNWNLLNDVFYKESTNGGWSFSSQPAHNITDYSDGGAISSSKIPEVAYMDVSALYVDDVLHVVWNTSVRDLDASKPCGLQYASKLWHWDSKSMRITLVHDASEPSDFECPPHAWALSTSKPNISECDGNLYVSFARFIGSKSGRDCCWSERLGRLYASGDVYITGSSDGGLTWHPDPDWPHNLGTASNLTHTNTNGSTSGDCLSEDWPSMAKYSSRDVHIEYICDLDAALSGMSPGADYTKNPVMYLNHKCYLDPPGSDLVVRPDTAEFWLTVDVVGPDPGLPGVEPVYFLTQPGDFFVTLFNKGHRGVDYKVKAVSQNDWLRLISDDRGFLPQGGVEKVLVSMGPFNDTGELRGELIVLNDDDIELKKVPVIVHIPFQPISIPVEFPGP